MTKKMLIIFGTLVAMAASVAVQAQEETTIEYGEEVRGEITNREFEIPYLFSGNEGDVIVVELEAVEPLGNLNSPLLILLDSENDTVADTSSAFSFGESLLVAELPEDGTYTILATRADGRAGDSEGEFTLKLIHPPTLTTGEVYPDTVSSEVMSI